MFVELCLCCQFALYLAEPLILSLNSLTYAYKSTHSNSSSSSAANPNLIFIPNTLIYSTHSISSRCSSIHARSSKLPISKSLLGEFDLNCFFLILEFVLLYIHKFIFLSFLQMLEYLNPLCVRKHFNISGIYLRNRIW